jgi:EpsI family protein
LVAAGVLIVSGLAFRTLAERLNRTSGEPTLPEGTLERIPLRIGDWVGRDDPLDQRVREATDSDDLVNRSYALQHGSHEVGFYVSYGARARDLQPHRPDVCYPSNGWTSEGIEFVELPMPNGASLDCRLLKFGRGGFDERTIVVANYYIVDDAFFPDVSFVRSQAWKGESAVGYTAQVQVACSTSAFRNESAARAAVERFAAESAETVRTVLAAARSEMRRNSIEPSRGPKEDSP